MSLIKAHIYSLPMVVGVALIVAIAVSGCGNTVNDDYEPSAAGGYHPFMEPARDNHNGFLVENDYDFDVCAECHGTDLRGVDNGVAQPGEEMDRSCYKCHSGANHGVGMQDAEEEHPDTLRAVNWQFERCFDCHLNSDTGEAANFGGSCSSGDCHNAMNHGFGMENVRLEHPAVLRSENWEIGRCDICHSFTGSLEENDFGGSCSNSICHTSEAGPQACNTCHGRFSGDPNDPVHRAPPASLDGGTDVSTPGVGAHEAHLTTPGGFRDPVECQTCHIVPSAWDDQGHILGDDTPGCADVVFSAPADARELEPVYDYDDNTCSSTHCHWGKTATWTEIGGWNICGDCHAVPPEGRSHEGRIITDCFNCHGGVIDNMGAIIAPDLHINGQIDFN